MFRKLFNKTIEEILRKVSVIDTEGNEMFISDKVREIHSDYVNV